jgi:general secretion pathway protein M
MSLPEGARGRLLAVAVLIAALDVLWLGVAQPLLDWHAGRAAQLDRESALLRRMQVLTAALPSLRQAAEAARQGPDQASAALEGATDAIAAATLQQSLDELAGGAGVRIGSVETLPAEAAGAWQAITVRVTVTAAWPPLIGLLQAIAGAPVAMQVDTLQLRPPPRNSRGAEWPIDAAFTVTAWRARADGKP